MAKKCTDCDGTGVDTYINADGFPETICCGTCFGSGCLAESDEEHQRWKDANAYRHKMFGW